MDTFSYDQLDNATPITVSDELKAIIQSEGEESFPDDEGVTFIITNAIAADQGRFFEVTPDMDTGYEKYIFQLNEDNCVTHGYALEDDVFSLLFTTPFS